MAYSAVGRRSPEIDRPNMSDLRIVLLGKSVSENSRVGNFLLGRAAFDSEAPPDVVERVGGKLKDRHVIVINSPQLLQTNISDHQITQTVRECVNLSDPGPHVFILALQHNDFTEEDMRRVKYVLEKFSEEAIKRTIVVTKKRYRSIISYVMITSAIQQLIKECGGGSLQLDERKPECQSEILDKMDKILEENKKECLTCERYEDVEGTSVAAEQEKKDNEKRLFHKDDGTPKDSDEVSTNVSGKQKLNLVLCGSDATLTVSVSKLLQGKTISSSHQQLNSEECVRRHVELHGHRISLMELPALSRLSEEEVMHQTLRCVSLCDPGVHVFLLIVPAGPLTDEDKAEIDKIKTIFDSREHFILLFTSDLSVEGPVKDSTESQRLISHCGGQFRVIGLKEPENSQQIPELLEYIENMKTEPYSLQMYVKALENRVRRDAEEKLSLMENKVKELKQRNQSEGVKHNDDDLRIVLLGKTGVGKSATGNTILRKTAFTSKLTSCSVTRECQKEITEFNRRQITVIDTPGLFDTGVDNDETWKEVVKCFSMAAPGPHVFLLVIQLGRFTQEEKDAVKMIQEAFGEKSRMYTMVLFTRGDELGETTIQDFIEGDGSLQNVVQQCGKRYHLFNNKETEDRKQVSELLDKIDCIVKVNGGSFYTNEMFQNVEKNIKEEQERIMKEKEEEIKRKEEELRAKYEAEIEQMKKEKEIERKKMQNELKKSEEDFKKREEEIKKETNDNVRKELQRELEEQQKLFEEKNKIKENALEEQQQNFIKYLEEKHEKEKQKLQEKIQKQTRLQAEYEYNEKLNKEVAKALDKAKEEHEMEKAEVLREAEEKYETEKAKVLQEAEENYKLEKDKILQETEEKQGKEKAKALQEAEEKYEREKAKSLQEAEEKQEKEKAKALQEAEENYKREKAKALQEAEEKHETEKTNILQEVEEKYKAEKAKALQEAAVKHKKKKAEALQEAAAKHKEEKAKALQEVAEKLEEEKAKALQEYEEKLPNAAKLARDWSRSHHIFGGAAGGFVGAWQDRFGKK